MNTAGSAMYHLSVPFAIEAILVSRGNVEVLAECLHVAWNGSNDVWEECLHGAMKLLQYLLCHTPATLLAGGNASSKVVLVICREHIPMII